MLEVTKKLGKNKLEETNLSEKENCDWWWDLGFPVWSKNEIS